MEALIVSHPPGRGIVSPLVREKITRGVIGLILQPAFLHTIMRDFWTAHTVLHAGVHLMRRFYYLMVGHSKAKGWVDHIINYFTMPEWTQEFMEIRAIL